MSLHPVQIGCTGRPNDFKGVDMVRHHRRIAPAIALALALATAAPASARFDLNPAAGADSPSTSAHTNLCSEVCSASGYTAHNTGAALPHDPRSRAVALAGAGHVSATTPRPTTVRVVTTKNDFDWGDAGIGAGGAIALMTLLGGAAFAMSSGRRRAARSTA
jgi:hypothetical protein